MTRCQVSLRPCTAPLSCSLQPLLKLSLLSLRPSLLQFVSIVSLLLNHGNPIFEPVCVFLPFPFLPLLFRSLIEMNFSFDPLHRRGILHRYEFGPPKFFSKTFEFSIIFYSTWQTLGGFNFKKHANPAKRIETVGNHVKTVVTCEKHF